MPGRIDEIAAHRLAKLGRIREKGLDPYPHRFQRSHSTAKAVALFLQAEANGAERPGPVTVAGRIVRLRDMGRATFMDLRDGTGKLQVMASAKDLGAEQYEGLRELDIGDFLGVEGVMFRTRTGEITVAAHSCRLLAKSLQPLPEKWHGLTDVEKRYRQRYLDLISSEQTRAVFAARTRITSALRRFLDERGFLEVETPVLHDTAGGAMARPFVTYHNALDRKLYLRIALELHLKRLIVGGIDRVYEIGRIFRNEGLSTRHNPEFTLLEAYQAYADYNDMMALVEEMVSGLAQDVTGATSVTFAGTAVDLRPPWKRQTLREAILEQTDIDFLAHDAGSLREEMRSRGLDAPEGASRGKLADMLLDACVQPALIQPTFLLDYPLDISPLAKRKPGQPELVERFEGFAGGMEIANAFSELNDPLEQRERFREQMRQREAGDEEAEVPDEDFLLALEYGMPPTGGLGVGVDRLVMLLTDQQSIRDVILFPQLRSK